MKWISGKWHTIWAAYHVGVIERMEARDDRRLSQLRRYHYNRFNHHFSACCCVKGKGIHAA